MTGRWALSPVSLAREEGKLANRKARTDSDLPGARRVYHHWVEIKDLQTSAVRKLALSTVAKIPLTKEPWPSEEVLQLEDGTRTLEVPTLQDLVEHLRKRYPDGQYERTLREERDRESEQRREAGLNTLIDLLVEQAMRGDLKT